MRGVCQVCGCTEEMPCVDRRTAERCSWIDASQTVCSHCDRLAAAMVASGDFDDEDDPYHEPPLVEAYNDAQATEFIRAMRGQA